ncbi:hypothetical protein LSUB1_G006306 [Lachnellula subtilissima]|uniref:Heterokaryon incompatibility domain-containing protein n=1 Tax=Lachnellula subtilissima TaxID=602034 RepID=A0A8H8RG68_9HELO|nr:hypothetical protein LSUB1_G006306 [Lachnellula subtilissima]
MDRSSIADVPGGATPHLCQYCENIIFTLSNSISFTYRKFDQARKDGCRFFQIILEKHPIADCDEGGYIDFHWVDGAIKLFYSHDHGIHASPLFVQKDSPASVHFKIRPLNPFPGSKESFDLIRGWIHRCDERHTRCKKLRTALSWQGPTRLIDVGNVGSKNVCVCFTVLENAVQYAALSYCWGGEQESKTVSARLEERRKGFPLAELSETIQDAVITTRRLGLRYLWVDAICIIQDDEADGERERSRMDQIYSGASITIVAARARMAADGFLQHRDVIKFYGTVCRVKYRRSSEGNGEVGSGFLSANGLDITYDDPIDLRGWTFQERHRSFRTLRFGSKQTVWECPGDLCVDGGENFVNKSSSEGLFTGTVTDLSYPYHLDDPRNKDELGYVLKAWQDLVQEYSERTLSQRTDRLPAFAAMAKAFGTFLQLEPEQYLAGLWAFDICMQLRWRRPDHVLGDGWCNERHGPTWSWASLDGPIAFDHPRLRMGVDTLKLVKDECQIGWKSPDFKYGEVEFARLTVYGFLCRSIWREENFIGRRHGTQHSIVLPLKAHWDCYEERAPEVWCLEINRNTSGERQTSYGILLAKPVGNIYKRLGYFEFYHNELKPEQIKAGVDIQGLPLNSNWFDNGGYKKICIE